MTVDAEPPTTLGAWRRSARQRIAHSDSPALDVDLLLGQVLTRTRTQVLAMRPECVLDAVDQTLLEDLLTRRVAGEPMAYLLGHKEFFGLDLAVNSHVLVPRPDTETLVDAVLECCTQQHLQVLDLGTGSGAIALALAEHRSDWRIVATDVSRHALIVAWENCLRYEAVQVRLVQADWCQAFSTASADIIVSNPPYIGTDESVEANLRFEPASALYAGRDGLQAIRAILQDAPRVLRPDGMLFLEHGYDQGAAVRQLLRSAGFVDVQTRTDLAGHERVTSGRKLAKHGATHSSVGASQ